MAASAAGGGTLRGTGPRHPPGLSCPGRYHPRAGGWRGHLPRAEQRANLPEKLFPDSNLPNFNEIAAAADARFTVRYADHEPLDYARTLRAWIRNIRAAEPNLSRRYGATTVKHHLQNFMLFTMGFESRRISLYRIILEKRSG
jgi:cyclopropane fatty-acyl-phospholipid synthase-like methyltransferase